MGKYIVTDWNVFMEELTQRLKGGGGDSNRTGKARGTAILQTMWPCWRIPERDCRVC